MIGMTEWCEALGDVSFTEYSRESKGPVGRLPKINALRASWILGDVYQNLLKLILSLLTAGER